MVAIRETTKNSHAVTYEEAAVILRKNVGTIAHAVSRGVLTPLPERGVVNHLAKEQVKLFINKRLSLRSLNEEEEKRWKEYADISVAMSIPSNVEEKIDKVTQELEGIKKAIEKLVGMASNSPNFLFPLTHNIDELGEDIDTSRKRVVFLVEKSEYVNPQISQKVLAIVTDEDTGEKSVFIQINPCELDNLDMFNFIGDFTETEIQEREQIQIKQSTSNIDSKSDSLSNAS